VKDFFAWIPKDQEPIPLREKPPFPEAGRTSVTSPITTGISRSRLIKPGLKPVSGLFGWNLLPPLLAEFGAIRQSLIVRGAAALVHEIVTLPRAARDPSMLTAGMISLLSSVARVTTMTTTCMTSMMSPVAARVTAMSARVTTTSVPSAACKYRHSADDKDYADD
jgi:hypothetical protein